MLRVGAALAVLWAAACADPLAVVPLPELDGMRSVLIGPPGEGAWRALELPFDALALELPALPAPRAHAALLAFPQSLLELGLAAPGGVFEWSASPYDDRLPEPARALTLNQDLSWSDDDTSRWSERRIPPVCRGFSMERAQLGGVPSALLERPEGELLVATVEPAGVWSVVEGAPRALEGVVPPETRTLALGLDPRGRAWVAFPRGPSLELRELSRTGTVARVLEVSTRALGDTPAVHALAVGDAEGKVEAFMLASASDGEPRFLHYIEGEHLVHDADIERPAACASPEPRHHYLERGELGRASFWMMDDAIGGYTTRNGGQSSTTFYDVLPGEVCGGVALDGRLDPVGAMAIPDESPHALALFERDETHTCDVGGLCLATWTRHELGPTALDGGALVRLGAELFASAHGGVLELQPRKEGGYRACPVVPVGEGSVRAMIASDDALFVAEADGAVWRLTPR